MKTIVFAYSEFGCIGIETLLKCGYDIAAVFTYPDDPNETVFYRSVAKLCVDHGLKAYTLDNGNEALLHTMSPDYIFSFYYRSLLPQAILNLASKGAYNLHGSLLPHYRGRAPVNWVIVNGETQTGVTLHHMIARADAGDIVAQTPVAIAYDDTAFTLQHKLLAAAKMLLETQLPLIARAQAVRTPQDLTKGSYYGKRSPSDGQIDWSKPAETIRNLVRALDQPYPGAFGWVDERKVFFWKCSVESTLSAAEGTVVSLSPLIIGCGQGALIVKVGQVDGGLYLSGEQLAQALNLAIGRRFAAYI